MFQTISQRKYSPVNGLFIIKPIKRFSIGVSISLENILTGPFSSPPLFMLEDYIKRKNKWSLYKLPLTTCKTLSFSERNAPFVSFFVFGLLFQVQKTEFLNFYLRYGKIISS